MIKIATICTIQPHVCWGTMIIILQWVSGNANTCSFIAPVFFINVELQQGKEKSPWPNGWTSSVWCSFPWGNEPVHWKFKMLPKHIPKNTLYVWWQKTLKHYYSLTIPNMIPGFYTRKPMHSVTYQLKERKLNPNKACPSSQKLLCSNSNVELLCRQLLNSSTKVSHINGIRVMTFQYHVISFLSFLTEN